MISSGAASMNGRRSVAGLGDTFCVMAANSDAREGLQAFAEGQTGYMDADIDWHSKP